MSVVGVNTTDGTGSKVTQFMVSIPKRLTSATGMDAMTYAIGAFQAKTANPLTDKDAHLK